MPAEAVFDQVPTYPSVTELRVLQLHWDVLSHPFYTRWSAGEQRRHELNGSC